MESAELKNQLLNESKHLTRRGRRYEYFGGSMVFAASGAIIVGGMSMVQAIGFIGIGLLLSIGGAICLIQAAITEKLLALEQMRRLRREEGQG
jgi:hypothetical protein